MGKSTTKINKSAGQRLHCRDEQMSSEQKFGWKMQERPNEEWKAAHSPTPWWARHPQTPSGDVSLLLEASCTLDFQLNLMSAFSFLFSPILESPNTSWKPGLQAQLDGDTRNAGLSWAGVKCRNPDPGYVFNYLVWRKYKTKKKNLWFPFGPWCGGHDLHILMHQGLQNSPVPNSQ